MSGRTDAEYLGPKVVVVLRQALGHGQEALYKDRNSTGRDAEAWNSILHPKDYRHKAMAEGDIKELWGLEE